MFEMETLMETLSGGFYNLNERIAAPSGQLNGGGGGDETIDEG